jgi:PAS domain S-box-containing protein
MALKISLCYALLGWLWILWSGWLLHRLVQNPSSIAVLENVKGWFYVSVTAFLLGMVLNRCFREIRRSAASDIAQRKQAEDEMRQRLELQDQIARIATTVPGMIYSFQMRPDGSFCVPFATPAIAELCGLQPEDVRGNFSPFLARVHPDDAGPLRESIVASARTMTRWQGAFRLRHPQKGEIWVEAQSEPRLEPDFSILWHGYVQDVTEQKRADEVLRQSEAEFRAMFEVASIGMAQADARTGQWLRVNQKMCAITGYSADEMLRMQVPAITHPEDRESDWDMFQRVVRGETSDCRLEKRYVRKDGSIAWVNVNMTIIRDAAGQPLRTLATIEDITERKQLEAQLRQAQKLEAIGQLAGGVAHDFNNILAAIMMHLGLLRLAPGLNEETRHALEDLEAHARRAAGLTRQLLMFSRRSVLAVKPLDLNEVVANLLKMLRRLIGEQIDLRFDGKSALPLVEADAGMMEQVLMNLTVNARDAMPKGGRITISTSLAEVDGAQAASNSNGRPGRFVCLTVSDKGSGMDAATLKRLFEPFFTTKEAGKGTGLGLATVHGIVAQHKGWVEVDSQLGEGSTFRVYLPATTQSQVEAPQIPQSERVRRGQETILLVEDDSQVRRVVGRSLRALGYQVHEAGNGQEAMRLWQTYGGQVQLLITDMVMPEGMTGLELTEQLQALKPGLKAIISSGYSAEIVHAGAPGKAGVVYLPKPYATRALADLIRDCLDAKPPSASLTDRRGSTTISAPTASASAYG